MAMSSKDSQERHFSRRLTAAVQGLHLPSEEELLRGMNFFRNDLDEDIREYAERLSRRIRKRGDPALASLAAALEELTVEQSQDGVQSLVPVPRCRGGGERRAARSVPITVPVLSRFLWRSWSCGIDRGRSGDSRSARHQ